MVGIQENEIEEGQPEGRDRQDGAEEEESHDRRLTAKTGHPQALACCVGFKRLAQVELLDDPLHVGLRFCPQFSLVLPLGQARHALYAQALALAGRVFHPRVEPVARQKRQHEGGDGGESGDRRKRHDDELRVEQVSQEPGHGAS